MLIFIWAIVLVIRLIIGGSALLLAGRAAFITHDGLAFGLFIVCAFLVLVPAKYDPAIWLKEWTMR